MKHQLEVAISEGSGLSIEQVSKILVRSSELKHGDFAFPCFLLSKEWKVAPPECAKRLKETIKLPEEFERSECVGPYLNFFIKRGTLARKTLLSILFGKDSFASYAARNETIIVEYSSPNIAKNLHVGHLRTTLIGLSIERIYKKLGYNVITINHLGDWGVQFGYIWAACEIWGKPNNPSINSLVDLYVRATQLKKDQDDTKVSTEDSNKPNITELARNYFIDLEAGKEAAKQFWEWCLDLSLKEFKSIYKRLNINFDYFTGESFYSNQLPAVEEMIKKSGILQESRGALGVDLGKELGFARVFADDGRSLYITRDIAAAVYRHETFMPTKILYVVAAQQSLHFKQLVEIFKRINHPVANQIVHVPFGFVPGMKTREGTAILSENFLNEAHTRALQAYREEVAKRPDGLNEEEIAELVAIGATYFYFLKHTNLKDFNFSWKEALNFSGDSGAYVQYGLARIFSIENKAKQAGIDTSSNNLQSADFELLKEDAAHELVLLLLKFKEVLECAAEQYEPSIIANYALDIARALSRAYRELRVVGEEGQLALARLALFNCVKSALKEALWLIGVPTIERM